MADDTSHDEGRNVAVSIGVSEAVGFPFLRGAINAAKAFHSWANALKYESYLVTDERSQVTFSRFRFEMETALAGAVSPPLRKDDERHVVDAALSQAKPIRRLILFFAGHGLIKEMEQGLWFLSDSISEQRVVDAERLRRRLYRFGIDQIAIIADACRSLPKTVELADLGPDAILGRGPKSYIAAPPIDKFVAAQDGSESYSIPGESPEDDRALFSSLLIEALWGIRPSALRAPDNKLVTSQSLKKFLISEVPRLASTYNRTLRPDVITNFSEGEDIYFGDVIPKPQAPVFPKWPPAGALLETSAPVDLPIGIAPEQLKAVKKEQETLDTIRTQKRPMSFETGSGFAVSGDQIAHVLTEIGIVSGDPGQENQVHIGPGHFNLLDNATPVLIEMEDGLTAALTAMPGFIATILMKTGGVYALVYRPRYTPPTDQYASEDAIAKLESGVLKGDELRDLIVSMRVLKHYDPTLGTISAYVYESLGDIDSVRQMAYYYIANNKPIPFDIAMLANLKTRITNGRLRAFVPAIAARKPKTEFENRNLWTFESTVAADGFVGGVWPWMRQGWLLLDDYSAENSTLIDPLLIEIASEIAPARFSTFRKEAAKALAKHFSLEVRT